MSSPEMGWSVIWRKNLDYEKGKDIYMKNFKKAFVHFCIHAGGTWKGCHWCSWGQFEANWLSMEDTEASRKTLCRFGNTWSSSVWFELCYLEARWGIDFGKLHWVMNWNEHCSVDSVMELDPNVRNAWSDTIHLYPMDIPYVLDHWFAKSTTILSLSWSSTDNFFFTFYVVLPHHNVNVVIFHE